jgi:hypothetical protein
MTERARHPSRLHLDLYLAGSDVGSRAPHVSECGACQARLERMTADYRDFLERYPAPESLERPGRSSADLPEPAAVTRAPGRRPAVWLAAAVAVAAASAAALAIGLLLLPGRDAELASAPMSAEREKGGSMVEIAVQRDGTSMRYEDQPLRAGDVLAFRVTTNRRYLLVLSVEERGRINVFLTDPSGKRSRAVTPGRRRVLSQGIELDDYVGPERLIALLTDRPLSVATVRRTLAKLLRALPAHARHTLDLPLHRFDGDTLSWLLIKVAP